MDLWVDWANANKGMIKELYDNTRNKTLTDMFANTNISQARALCDILNNIWQQRKAKGIE